MKNMNIIEVASACSLSFQAQASQGAEARRLFGYDKYCIFLLLPEPRSRSLKRQSPDFQIVLMRFISGVGRFM